MELYKYETKHLLMSTDSKPLSLILSYYLDEVLDERALDCPVKLERAVLQQRRQVSFRTQFAD